MVDLDSALIMLKIGCAFVSTLLTHSSHDSLRRLLTVCSAGMTLVPEQLAPPTDEPWYLQSYNRQRHNNCYASAGWEWEGRRYWYAEYSNIYRHWLSVSSPPLLNGGESMFNRLIVYNAYYVYWMLLESFLSHTTND